MEQDSFSEQITAVQEAEDIASIYPIAKALEPFSGYLPDTAKPAHVLLSIKQKYGWGIKEVASVVLDVDAKNNPPITVRIEEPAKPDDLLPSIPAFRLQDGRIATFDGPKQYRVIELKMELPDGWNQSYPHKPEEYKKRAEVASGISRLFSVGSSDIVATSEDPAKARREADLRISRYDRYAEECLFISELLGNSVAKQLGDRHRHRSFADELIRAPRQAIIDSLEDGTELFLDYIPEPREEKVSTTLHTIFEDSERMKSRDWEYIFYASDDAHRLLGALASTAIHSMTDEYYEARQKIL